MMKNVFWLVPFLIFCLTQNATARDFAYADSTPFLGIENAAQVLKKSVCAVQIPKVQNLDEIKEWAPIGTGFLVEMERNATLVVTCKHVVQFAQKLKKTLYIGLDTENGYKRFLCEIAYLDPIQDIAILVPKKNSPEDINPQFKAFNKELFDDTSSLVEGRSVLIPGYPLALGIEDDQNHPVIRFGFVAQYTGKDFFLLDGVASHGNSGSPVFSLKHKESKLIGMVTGFQNDSISLYDDNGSLTAKLPYNSGLARCVTMEAILEALKQAKY